ncbi:MAG: DSBA oxidoreductase [Candidatus Levybacteria bacterium GW2011_GWB1_35_5]|nr:MAG: DSBA oxidoreductase [Candidatus Levybacteria bacterium GW2011_GWB1_35_5]
MCSYMAFERKPSNNTKNNLRSIALTLPSKISVAQILVILLIVASFLIGVLITKVLYLEKNSVSTTLPSEQQATAPSQPAVKVNIKDVDIKNEPYIGKVNAPVVMAYWMDYQCPFCRRFETETLPTLIEKYVNTGKLKIVFKDFQFLGEDSQTAGLFENAIWETAPQSFGAWQKAMYEKQDDENGGWGKKEDIIALIRTIPGIDADKVSLLMEQKKDVYQKELDEDKQEGSNFGVSGTPGFVIGDQSIVGAQPLSTFTQIIDALLKNK